MDEVAETQFGFTWGPVKVSRWASFPRGRGKLCRVIGITGAGGHELTIHVSPTGRSIRVFRKGHGELK